MIDELGLGGSRVPNTIIIYVECFRKTGRLSMLVIMDGMDSRNTLLPPTMERKIWER